MVFVGSLCLGMASESGNWNKVTESRAFPTGGLLKMLSLNQWVWDGPLGFAFLMRWCQCCEPADHTLTSKTLLRPFFTKEQGTAIGR